VPISFRKRQKEFKRMEKQKEKAERRAQKKLAKRAEGEGGQQTDQVPVESVDLPENPDQL